MKGISNLSFREKQKYLPVEEIKNEITIKHKIHKIPWMTSSRKACISRLLTIPIKCDMITWDSSPRRNGGC